MLNEPQGVESVSDGSMYPEPAESVPGTLASVLVVGSKGPCANCGRPVPLNRKREYCCCYRVGCGRKLAGKQEKYCSRRCSSAQDLHDHPRLGRLPVVPDGRAIDKVIEVCADGRWRSIPEIAHETGHREVNVYRRIRESATGRKGRHIGRFAWESRPRKPAGRSRTKEYRLVLNPQAAA